MTKKTNSLLLAITLFIAVTTSFISCSSYDEQDVTIIGYLKINDLLESKLSKTCDDEIKELVQAYKDYNDAQLASAFFGWDYNVGFNYDTDIIKVFNKKYTAADGVSVILEKLEADIATELWGYLTLIYSDEIPSKAQNIEEGRYYTIEELKLKYPEYEELEIEEFRPMELINAVMREKLFHLSDYSEGDVNLRTLYVYYLANRVSVEESNIDYVTIIKRHFDNNIPSSVNVEEVKTLFTN